MSVMMTEGWDALTTLTAGKHSDCTVSAWRYVNRM